MDTDMDIAFSGIGYTLGEAPDDNHAAVGERSSGRHVPSLREACLSTLERYIDLIEDIGATPFYLIESVLRKCNAEQLARIEDHTEDLHESTDELWYLLATNEYKTLRERSPQYNQSGDWRSNYEAAKQEEKERFERVGAKLRQSYSRLDKNRQGRSVIVDPNLRLPAATRSSSTWSAPRKPKTLFEKARMEARKITQMYATNPIPTRIRNVSTGSTVRVVSTRPPSRSISQLGASTSTRTESRHIIAPSSVFAAPRLAQAFMANRNSLGAMDSGLIALTPIQAPTKARYSYKNRPVVYLSTPRLNLGQQNDARSRSPTKPSQTSPPISSSAPGAIVDFFKQLNPIHSHLSSSKGESSSRSPTSPVIPASNTIKLLRADSPPPPLKSQSKPEKRGSSSQQGRNPPKKVKCDGDYRWLEDDSKDDDDKEISRREHGQGSLDQTKPKSKATPLSLQEAGRQFFNQLISK
ncbi:hypothetical protein BG006_006972 [Podila minutissima]|uniref:Elongin-A n=1 Tax=Podila minutissima TaxID=64525 RepID=A0A9P5SKV6_9FUNG|nr:hypothetical protein BG006_006972 [Podila minutissima]